MFNSFYILLLRLNNRPVTDGNFALAIIEFVFTAIVVAIIRNT